MAEEINKKSRKIRKFVYHNQDLDELLTVSRKEFLQSFSSRLNRKFRRSNGINGTYARVIDKVVKSKKNLQPGEKPRTIKTHLRNGVIVPEMVGGYLGVYNGKEYKEVEIKFDMIGRYFGEFSITYKPTLRKAAHLVEGKKKGKKGKK